MGPKPDGGPRRRQKDRDRDAGQGTQEGKAAGTKGQGVGEATQLSRTFWPSICLFCLPVSPPCLNCVRLSVVADRAGRPTPKRREKALRADPSGRRRHRCRHRHSTCPLSRTTCHLARILNVRRTTTQSPLERYVYVRKKRSSKQDSTKAGLRLPCLNLLGHAKNTARQKNSFSTKLNPVTPLTTNVKRTS